MDIVRRAYNNVWERTRNIPAVQLFHASVQDEVKRLIRERVYLGRDWPKEWGELPAELRSKRTKKC